MSIQDGGELRIQDIDGGRVFLKRNRDGERGVPKVKRKAISPVMADASQIADSVDGMEASFRPIAHTPPPSLSTSTGLILPWTSGQGEAGARCLEESIDGNLGGGLGVQSGDRNQNLVSASMELVKVEHHIAEVNKNQNVCPALPVVEGGKTMSRGRGKGKARAVSPLVVQSRKFGKVKDKMAMPPRYLTGNGNEGDNSTKTARTRLENGTPESMETRSSPKVVPGFTVVGGSTNSQATLKGDEASWLNRRTRYIPLTNLRDGESVGKNSFGEVGELQSISVDTPNTQDKTEMMDTDVEREREEDVPSLKVKRRRRTLRPPTPPEGFSSGQSQDLQLAEVLSREPGVGRRLRRRVETPSDDSSSNGPGSASPSEQGAGQVLGSMPARGLAQASAVPVKKRNRQLLVKAEEIEVANSGGTFTEGGGSRGGGQRRGPGR
ncbi:unnamed protein product, partial [Choristocarpus tenellus]